MATRYKSYNTQKKPRKKTVIYAAVAILVLAAAVFGGLALHNAVLRQEYPLEYADLIRDAAERYDLDPVLVASLIRTESRYRAYAESRVGALGLMQVMPETGEWIAEKLGTADFSPDRLVDPQTNIEMGCWYLHFLGQRFDSTELVLAAYNAGHNKVREWLDDPRYSSDGETLHTIPFPETDNYVDKVTDAYAYYLRLYRKELLPNEE